MPGRGPVALEDVHLAQPEEVDAFEVDSAVASVVSLPPLVVSLFSEPAPLFFAREGFFFGRCWRGWCWGLGFALV